MIKGFRCKETEKLWRRRLTRKFPSSLKQAARIKLRILYVSESLNQLRVPPSNRLEALAGSRKEQYSIRINRQWRICFRWESGDAYDVEIVDYH